VGIGDVKRGVKALRCLLRFFSSFELIYFDHRIFDEGVHRRGLTMVLLGRAIVCSRKLPVQTTVVSGTVLPQFAMQILSGVVSPQFWGKEWS